MAAMAPASIIAKYLKHRGFRVSEPDVIVIAQRLRVLEAKAGSLDAEAVVRDAEDEASPLHRFFLWDDKKAAHEYRITRARYLIRATMVATDIDGQSVDICTFFNVTTENGRSYVSAENVFESDELRAQIVDRATRELDSWILRFGFLSELKDLVNVIEAALAARKRAA
jgi:hypothetical protein